MKILKKIISGGQTGADIAGIDAAIEIGFPYGGWLPKGRKTETGKLPEKYLMQEMATGGSRLTVNLSEIIIFSDLKVILLLTNLSSHSTPDVPE